MALLLFSFAAGLATILAPCIWPLLPIVLSASSGEGKRRPLGLVLGLMTSFSVLTLAVSYLERALGVDPNVFRVAAVVIIGLLGISMIFPAIGARFEAAIGKLLGPLQRRTQAKGEGFLGGYVAGFSIGLVWAPCAGPILATIATLAATRAVNARVALVTLAYVAGVGIPLFLLSTVGSRLFGRLRRFNKHTVRIQQAFGVVMIAAALLIYTNYDKTLQLLVLNAFPSYGRLSQSIEEGSSLRHRLDELRSGGKVSLAASSTEEGRLADLGPAPEFAGISQWLNGPPLSIKQLRGKVVLVDFWTYSCVNCLRTLPYIKGWHQAYGPSGLVIVGVHTPEFAFEKEKDNVQKALRQFGIGYPVALDNDYGTWGAYNNRYWPAEYLIDANGHIRLAHFGEGRYDEMDEAIRALLAEAHKPVEGAAKLPEGSGGHDSITPETYLGRDRMERFSSEIPALGEHRFTPPKLLEEDHFAYDGLWNITGESATAHRGSALEFQFRAEKVFLVIGPRRKGDSVAVYLDGSPVRPEGAGADVKDGRAILDDQRLYNLVDLKGKVESRRLRLVLTEGTSVYAFTFG